MSGSKHLRLVLCAVNMGLAVMRQQAAISHTVIIQSDVFRRPTVTFFTVLV